ncbi:carbonic anhydrase [Mactra antiquata]
MSGDCHRWGYTNTNGPDKWCKGYPIAAEGKRQSPIDIKTSDVKLDADLKENPLKTKYKPEDTISLVNNGHTITCNIQAKSTLVGGPIKKDKYLLGQFHLHWGSSDDKGSEHTIDGKQFSAELHLVHYKKEYGSISNAADKKDGLAVLGVMITPGSENSTFQKIIDEISNLKKKDTEITVPNELDPASLLPENISDYWTYAGSLTTPPLYETVQWIVFKNPVEFSTEQIIRALCIIDQR